MMESAVPVAVAVAACPKSPSGNHEFRAMPEHLIARSRGDAPLFYCIYDLIFVTEKTLAEMKATP